MTNNYNQYHKPKQSEKHLNASHQVKENPPVKEEPEVKVTIEPTVKVTPSKITKVSNCRLLNLRENNTTNSTVKAVLKEDDELVLIKVIGEWAHVNTISGLEGYVMLKFIKEV